MASDQKNVVAKLQIIAAMAPEASVKQLASVMIELVNGVDKKQIGFSEDKK